MKNTVVGSSLPRFFFIAAPKFAHCLLHTVYGIINYSVTAGLSHIPSLYGMFHLQKGIEVVETGRDVSVVCGDDGDQ
jgi:hypothetical protein